MQEKSSAAYTFHEDIFIVSKCKIDNEKKKHKESLQTCLGISD